MTEPTAMALAVLMLYTSGLIEGEQDYYSNVLELADSNRWKNKVYWYTKFPPILFALIRFLHSMVSGYYHKWQAVQALNLGCIIGVMSVPYSVPWQYKMLMFLSGIAFGAGINTTMHGIRKVRV